MKVILSVADKEKINHTGDLIILKDVGDRAEISVTDGAVIILGKVGIFSSITVKITANFKNSLLEWDETKFPKPNIISDLFHENSVYCQNVSVNNRIFTGSALIHLGFGVYEIKSITEVMNSGKVKTKVKVDGKEYEGYNAYVLDKAVIVDNVLQHEQAISYPRVQIFGNVGAHSEIKSDIKLLLGLYGKNCTLISPNLEVYPIPEHAHLIKQGMFAEKSREFTYEPSASAGWYPIGNSKCFNLYANFKDPKITKLILDINMIAENRMAEVQQKMQEHINPKVLHLVTRDDKGLISELIVHVLDGYELVEKLNKLGNIYDNQISDSNFCY